jgi:YidC/Oxa1 family membrane protein insertase
VDLILYNQKGIKVNRNSIIAFILILATVTLFTSPQYNKFVYEKILKKPYPTKTSLKNKNSETNKEEKIVELTTVKANSEKNNNEIKKDSVVEKRKTDTIWVENEKIKIGISEKGADIVSIKMKDYKSSNNKEPIEIMDNIGLSGGSISIDGEDYSEKFFSLENNNEKYIKISNGESKKILFKTEEGEDALIKEYDISDDYKIGITIRKNNLSGKRVKIDWKSGIVESENQDKKIKNSKYSDIRKAHFYNNEYVQHIQMNKEENESSTGNFKWVGITSKYFMIAIVNDTINDADINIKGIINDQDYKNKGDMNYQMSYEKTSDENESKFWIYAGPNQYEKLKKYNIKLEKTLFPVTSWAKNILWADKWFPWVAEIILNVLLWLYKIFRDYGIAILVLTFLSRLITYPLTQSSMKSMSNMKDVQPKVEALRKRYKNNPQKMNQEVMALYKEEGINPLNPGCLPMFLQMPIFIALFIVLRKAIELRGATTMLLPWVNDLSKAEVIYKLPSAIPMYGDNIAIMPLIMAVLTFYQNKMTMKDPNQKAMIYIMPIFMLALFNSFPSGLVLYWTFSSALALAQQLVTEKLKNKKK